MFIDMSLNPTNVQRNFRFQWTIDVTDFCKDYEMILTSPVVQSFHKTKWCLKLNACMYSKGFGPTTLRVALERMDREPQFVIIGIKMSISAPGRSIQKLGKVDFISFQKGDSRSFGMDCGTTTANPFVHNMLTVHCEMWMISDDPYRPENSLISESFALTCMVVERMHCLWKLHNFSDERPVAVSAYPIILESCHRLVMKKVYWTGNSEFNIEIHSNHDVSSKLEAAVGKISIVDVEGKEVISSKSYHYFGSDGDRNIWNLLIPVTKETLIRDCKVHLLNDKLLMVCEFTLFTQSRNEIVSKDLIPSFIPTINAKEENLASKRKRNYNKSLDYQGLKRNRDDEPASLRNDLGNLYNQQMHCDVVLLSGNKFFPTHKSILCSRSPVFRAMFDNDMRESYSGKVEITDIDPDTLNQFLLYLYTETLMDLDWESSTKLLYAANKYQVELLKAECYSYLMSNISMSNVCGALVQADMYQDGEMKRICQEFIFKNATEVFISNDWKMFSTSNPLLSAEIIQKYFISKSQLEGSLDKSVKFDLVK